MYQTNKNGQTFLHFVAKYSTAGMAKSVIAILPSGMANRLSVIRDKGSKLARDLSEPGLKRDYIDQAGSYHVDFYHLEAPPKVLIFYSTKNRQAPESEDGEQTDAETEKDCVENYFIERNFPCKVIKDPTATEVFSTITDSQTEDFSGLLVFVMSHGEKGLVSVEGDPGYLLVQDLITHMCQSPKPKVSPD